ncbi:carbohydrate ABC transporter permease [Microbacterium sp. 18062]|uniref:carbohydrate ABC transporter permease n=1 Tax=Microbacterium sp. 18062 TaxID=2681410 RepID=UPI0013580729|nr:sugar ABC transporter permease [Microbacterium sp. 18062]
MDFSALSTAVLGVLVIPLAVIAWLFVGERLVDLLPYRRREGARAWAWLLLPALLGGAILLYPLVQTVVLSFQGSDGTGWVGLDNFAWVFSDQVLPVLRNNLLWVVVLPIAALAIGLVMAVLADRVRYGAVIRTVMLLPTAISLVAAGVIWRLMYAYQPSGSEQLGTINALIDVLGGETVAFLSDPAIATFSLIGVAVWTDVGLAMVMLSSALKNVDQETTEAAQLDGAGPFRVFWHITVPQIAPTIAVVYTTEVIYALKVFDVVYAMTNGGFNTDVIANRMYSELFRAQEFGHAAAIAVVLLVASIPVIVSNVRRFRAER